MTNVSALEKIAEHMQRMEENSPRVVALQYSLKLVGEKMEEGEKRIAELEARCAALAAENAESEKRIQQLIQIISNADNEYCMCGDAMKNHVHGGCGHPTGMFDYHYNQWLESGNKTPATDAFLAEVRAQGVEMFAAVLRRKGDDAFFDAIAEAQANAADQFAAQLRKGVQS